VLDLLADLVTDHGRTVVMVLHDLNLACRYADHLVAMRDGRIHVAGSPGDVVDPALVRDVFAVSACVIEDPVAGTPLCLPRTKTER
jgi:iron complex transport system ATP-binding protein